MSLWCVGDRTQTLLEVGQSLQWAITNLIDQKSLAFALEPKICYCSWSPRCATERLSSDICNLYNI